MLIPYSSKFRSKTILAVISNYPQYEILAPILTALQLHNDIKPIVLLSRKLLRRNPTILEALQKAGIDIRLKSIFGYELLLTSSLFKTAAFLTLTDPILHNKKRKPKDLLCKWLNIPLVVVQHGALQFGFNWSTDGKVKVDFAAKLILTWEKSLNYEHTWLPDKIRERQRVVGFPKNRLIPVRVFQKEFRQFLKNFNRRILICTNYNETFRFMPFDVRCGQDLIQSLVIKYPKSLFIYRSHRARNNEDSAGFFEKLAEKNSNFIISDRWGGPMKYSEIVDVLAEVDACISHASTAVLDAVFQSVPTAVLQNQWPQFSSLPQIENLASAENFLASTGTPQSQMKEISKIYGAFPENSNIAATCIAKFINRAMSDKTT